MEIQLLLLFGIMDLPDCFCLNSGYLVFERGKLKTEICQIFGDSVDMLKQIEMISKCICLFKYLRYVLILLTQICQKNCF